MELGRIDRERPAADMRLGAAVAECRHLVDKMFGTVRDLALGLRPSMLDDLGLQPALEWHVRDLTRRYGLDIELQTQGDFTALPDQYRTCVYRVIQEALTNCVRHARARSVKVSVRGLDRLEVSVIDDGVGFDPRNRREGLGLRGIEERVKELGGTMAIAGAAGEGTTLTIQLPVPETMKEATLARAAG
jgi:signal transduction histidine kinase